MFFDSTKLPFIWKKLGSALEDVFLNEICRKNLEKLEWRNEVTMGVSKMQLTT